MHRIVSPRGSGAPLEISHGSSLHDFVISCDKDSPCVAQFSRDLIAEGSRLFFFIYLERGERYCLHAAQDFVKSRNTFLLFEIFLIYTYAFVIFKSVSSLLRNCVSYVDYPSFCEKSLSPKYLKNRSLKIFHTPSNFRYLQKIHHSFQYCKTAFYSLEKRCFETFSKHRQSNNNFDF